MCPVLPSVTAIKVKSKDQAHRQAPIKGSRHHLGNNVKYDQNYAKINTTAFLSVLCPLVC